MSSEVKIEFIKRCPSKTQLKQFFTSKQHSGVKHGKVKDIRNLDEHGAILEFENQEDAATVAKKGMYKWSNGTELGVSLHKQQGATQDDDDTDRTVVLEIEDEDIHEDMLSLYLEDVGEVDDIDTSLTESSGITTVKFKRPEDASSLLKSGVLPIEELETEIKVRRNIVGVISESSSDLTINVDYDRTLHISGVDPGWKSATLKKLFEKKGGGEILELNTDNISDGQIVIKFKENQAAESILLQTPLKFMGKSLHASRPKLPDRELRRLGEETTHAVLISNIPKKDKKYVKLFLENKKMSSGGPIQKLDFDAGIGEAVVTFKHTTDAANILKNPDLKIDGQKLTIVPLDDSYNTDRTCAIVITGDISKVDEMYLTLHFESEGGDILKLFIHKESSTAYITFESPEIVDTILRKKSHVVDGNHLLPQRMYPAVPPPIIVPPIEPKTLLFNFVSVTVTQEHLRAYLEQVSGQRVHHSAFSFIRKGTVLVEFDGEPDVNAIKQHTIKYPLNDSMINVQYVPESSHIQIHNIEGHIYTDAYLEMTLNNIAKCDQLDIVEEPSRHAIAFVPHTDIRRVIQKLSAKKPELYVTIYHKNFGVELPSSNKSIPRTWTHSGLEFRFADANKVQAVIDDENYKGWFNETLKQDQICITWPDTPQEPFLLNSIGHDSWEARDFESSAKATLNELLKNFETKQVSCKEEKWSDFKNQLNEITHKKALIVPDDESYTVSIAGSGDDVNEVERQLSSFGNDVTNAKLDTCCVLLEGVTASTHKDKLMVHLEDEELVGENASVENIEMGQISIGRAIVTFSDSQAAKNLVKHIEICIDDNNIKVSLYTMQAENKAVLAGTTEEAATGALRDENMERTVVVEGIKSTWTEDSIHKFFKRQKIGGGPIDLLTKHEYDTNIVYITFREQSTAGSVLEKGMFVYEGVTLYVRKYQPVEPINTLEITSIPNGTTEDFLSLMFESKKDSGGGDIKAIKYDKEAGKAIITFHKCEDAEEVLQRTDIQIDGQTLNTFALDDSYEQNKVAAIKVSDFSDKINKKYLEVYFNNRRKSGGGHVEDVYFDKENNTAVVTFESREAVQRIIQKRNHCLENEILTIEMLRPAVFPPYIRYCVEPTSLLLRNLPQNITCKELTGYIKRVSDCKIESIRFSWEHQGIAEVIFDKIPDFKSVRDLMQSKPILGKMCSVQRVPQPRRLQSFNIGSHSEDYLESLIGGDDMAGDSLVAVVVNPRPTKHAVIEFQDGKDLQLIISKLKEEHPEMTVTTYNIFFGLVPPNVSLQVPSWFPKQVEIEQPPKQIALFIMKNKTQLNEIDKKIKVIDGDLKWPTHLEEKIVVQYNAKAFKVSDKNWTERVKTTVQSFKDSFTEVHINVLQQLWSRFNKQVNYMYTDTDAISFHKDNNANTITLVGLKEEVKKFSKEILAKKKQMEEDLRIRNTITTDRIKLDKHKLVLLRDAGKFMDKFSHVSNNIDVKWDLDKGHIYIKDIPDNIDKAKEEMFKIVKNIVEKKIKFSPRVLNIFKGDSTAKYLTTLVNETGIKVYWESDKDYIYLFALSNKDLADAENLFCEHLEEKTLTLTGPQIKVLKSDKWELFITKEMQKSDGRVDISTSATTITLYGTSDKVNTWYEDIDAFLKEHALTEKFLDIPAKGGVRYLANKIESIRREFPDTYLEIDIIKEGPRTGFLIKGKIKTCKKVEDKIRKLATDVRPSELPTKQPGIVEFFTQREGRDILLGLESRFKVAIEVAKDANQPLVKGTKDATEHDEAIQKLVVHKGNISVIVAQADLPTYKCDAIVNAANERMEHHGGLAGAIVKRGGKEIQDECSKHVRSNGPLISPEVYVSKAGKLRCKAIIHAVGPKWGGGRDNEENKLFEVVYEVLLEAKQRKFQRIALPAISTGIFKFPLKKALQTITEAIWDFCEKDGASGTPAEIHLVDFTEDITNAMQTAIEEKFRPSRDVLQTSVPEKLLATTKRGRKGEMIFDLQGKCEITVLTGDITNETADVIVHGSDAKLSLDGLIGSVLKRKAGQDFQDECKTKASIPYLVEFTTAGNLPCKQVLHADVGGKMNLEKWHKVIVECLKQTDVRSFSSIAFPALGTGNLGNSPATMAEIFMKAFAEYAKTPNTGVKTIRVVVFEDAMTNKFQESMKSLIGSEKRTVHETVAAKSEDLTLVIYGDSEKDIQDVKDELNKVIASQIEVVTLESQTDQDNIENLSDEQVERITTIASSHKVQLTLKAGHRHKYIRIRGEKNRVYTMKKMIEDIFAESKNKAYHSILAQKIQWEYLEDDGSYSPYPENINARIEGDYKSKKPYSEWNEEDDSDTPKRVRIDFKEMKELSVGSSSPPIIVRRTEHDIVPLPKTWSAMDPNERCSEMLLDPQSREFKKLADEFNTQTGNTYNVHEIKRIQNPSLYKQLKIKEKEMEISSTTRPISRMLWHGTTEDTIQKVNATGFNRSYCGLNATYYGKGVYFAVDARYSCQDTYSKPDSTGFKFLYYCTVLTGDYTKGEGSMIDTPSKDPQKPHIKYDSVVNDLNNIVMYVVFNDTQAYPDYILKIKQK